MTDAISTAPAAGAQEVCAAPAEDALSGMGSITQQPGFAPIHRREIMTAVNTCGRDLGLRPAAIVVLDALLSCLPCRSADGRDNPVTPMTLLTVYASNETLCFRARGLTDRQLRRHLLTLETAGLLIRRDSANGKRFPIKRAGRVIGAYGLDLSPLFARSAALLQQAADRREEAEHLRGLKAQILQMRTICATLNLDEVTRGYLDGLRNLLRRASLTLTEARAVISRLSAIRDADAPQPAAQGEDDYGTCRTSVSDGQNVRHKEPESESINNWQDLTEISAFYPEPDTAHQGARILFDLGRMLRIGETVLAEAGTRFGLWQLLRIIDRMIAGIADIHSPDAYLRSMLR